MAALRAANPQKKKIYSGHGWANYAASYFNDCVRLAQGIKYSLRPGGTALVVIGNSILQGIMMPTDMYFGKIAESVGLDLVRIDIPRATRVGNSIISSDVRVGVETAEASNTLYEAVVELRRRDRRIFLCASLQISGLIRRISQKTLHLRQHNVYLG